MTSVKTVPATRLSAAGLGAVGLGALALLVAPCAAAGGPSVGGYDADGTYYAGSYDAGTTVVSGSQSYNPVHGAKSYAKGGHSGYDHKGYGHKDFGHKDYGHKDHTKLVGHDLCANSCAAPKPSYPESHGEARVLGCYSVCKPPAPKMKTVQTQVLTQVVHPVIYVRYPVPYTVTVPGPTYVEYSRYGDVGAPCGYKAYKRRC